MALGKLPVGTWKVTMYCTTCQILPGWKGPRYLLNFYRFSWHLIEIPRKFHVFYQPHTIPLHRSLPMPVIFVMSNAVTCGSPTVTITDCGKVRITNVDSQRWLRRFHTRSASLQPIDGDRASYTLFIWQFAWAVASMDSGWYASQVRSYTAWFHLLDRDIEWPLIFWSQVNNKVGVVMCGMTQLLTDWQSMKRPWHRVTAEANQWANAVTAVRYLTNHHWNYCSTTRETTDPHTWR